MKLCTANSIMDVAKNLKIPKPSFFYRDIHEKQREKEELYTKRQLENLNKNVTFFAIFRWQWVIFQCHGFPGTLSVLKQTYDTG